MPRARRFKIGDLVEVTHYTPGTYAPGVADELGTEALFRSIVGTRFGVRGFDEHGHIELRPTRLDTIWIKPEDVKLVPKKQQVRLGREAAQAWDRRFVV